MATEAQSHELYSLLIQTLTKHFPDTPLAQRTDCVMDIYQKFHKWATGENDEVNGATVSDQEAYYEEPTVGVTLDPQYNEMYTSINESAKQRNQE